MFKIAFIAPRWGWFAMINYTQSVALGYYISAPLGLVANFHARFR